MTGIAELGQAVPQRLHHAGPEPAQRGGEARGRVAQPVGVRAGLDALGLVREQRLRAPFASAKASIVDRLDPVGERVVGFAPRAALLRVGDARARADEHEPLTIAGPSASAAWSAIRPPIE